MDTVGIFELKTAGDLFRKLQHDYALLSKAPANAYLAFNFFVTAEHILDWLYPGRKGAGKRKQCREREVVLQICSHVASGAKHFRVEAPHHDSVRASRKTGSYFPKGCLPSNYFPHGYFPEATLALKLKGTAALKYGSSISALKLATAVMEFWSGNPEVLGN
jgi:hypothetical protein